MIVLIEPNKNKKKKLCDLINRERIVPVKFPGEVLNFLYKYQKKVDLIIANSNMPFVSDLISKKLLEKLCSKLNLPRIPLVGYYKEEDENTKKLKEAGIDLIKYDERNSEFPFQYLSLIRKEYPGLNIDVTNIMEIRDYWLGIKQKPEKKELDSEEIEDILNVLSPTEEKEVMDITEISAQVKPYITQNEYDKVVDELDEWKKKYNKLEKEHKDLKVSVKDIIDTAKK